jgi:hypothetical protein
MYRYTAVPSVVRGVMNQFKARGSSPKTKTAVFGLLRELASSFPGALGGAAGKGLHRPLHKTLN